MTSAPPPPAATPESVTLSPHYGVALGMVGLGMACLLLQPLWGGAPLLALGISVLGLFLLLQRCCCGLNSRRMPCWCAARDALLRRFPYDDWLGWTLFWPGLPVLFYFREQRSIHLLPVLFQSATLRSQLHLHLPHLAANDDGPTHS
jgi:hypothetical protein